MAHFAKLNNKNEVTEIIVISNADILDSNGIEQEAIGVAVCKSITGYDNWKQTSYNRNFRNKYAAIGDIYQPEADVFYNPIAPFPSWNLDAKYEWQPPVSKPNDEKEYFWNENLLAWVEIQNGS